MQVVFKCLLSSMSREIEFKQLTLADEILIQDKFPDYSEQITETNINMSVLSEVVYMAVSNKELFKPVVVDCFDDNGEKTSIKRGGLELFRSKVVTEGDQTALVCAFVEVCNKSRPDMDELVKKKRKLKKLTFISSWTLFAAATGGLIVKLCHLL